MLDLERLLTISIKDISRPDDLFDALDVLAQEINRVIASYRLDARQLQELAQDVAHLRHLISVISTEDKSRPGAGNDIVARYLDLEGRLKELRDDHPKV